MEPVKNSEVVKENVHAFDADPAQLAKLLSGAESMAEFSDRRGNIVQVTAEQLKEAGVTLEALEGAEVVQFEEVNLRPVGEDQHLLFADVEGDIPQQQCNSVTGQIPSSQQIKDSVLSKPDDGTFLPVVPASSIPVGSIFAVLPNGQDMTEEEKLRLAVDNVRRAIQETEKRSEEMTKFKQVLETRNQLICAALIKTTSAEDEAILPVRLPNAPDVPVANVILKRFTTEQPPEDATVFRLGSGEQWYVQVEKLTGQENLLLLSNTRVDGLWVCDRCARRFSSFDQLKLHQQIVHPHKDAYYCRFCNRELFFANDASFKAHIRNDHRGVMEREAAKRRKLNLVDDIEEEPDWEEIYAETEPVFMRKCPICNLEFPSNLPNSVHAHEEHDTNKVEGAVSPMKPPVQIVTYDYYCSLCGKRYSKLQMLEKHSIAHRMPKHGYLPFTCRFCGKTFKWNENLLKHLMLHNSQEPIRCSACCQIFSNATRLDVHYRARHGDLGYRFPCSFCPEMFRVKEDLAKHVLIHGQWRCNDCGRRFADQLFFQRHQLKHSSQDFVCDLCGKIFYRPSNLSAHRNLHTGEKPYACKLCSMRFMSRSSWKIHMKWHDSPKRFTCETCGAAFKMKENFDVHVKVHKPPKPFGCNLCHRFYDRIEELYVHSTGHKPTGKYCCLKCKKTFFGKKAFQSHARWHEQPKPFVCALCDRSFPTTQRIQTHMISHIDRPEISHLIVAKNSCTDEVVKVTYVEVGKEPIELEGHQMGELTRKIISKAHAAAQKVKKKAVQPDGATTNQEVIECQTRTEEPNSEEIKDAPEGRVACSTSEEAVAVQEPPGENVTVEMEVETISGTDSSVLAKEMD
ncbi:zf-C2H2 and zf-C2H2 4 and zf-H2C2 2 domain contai ning protein [Trichuris trichiura]|uniref:Zf-C2H2 and zf-C2H2 4 and zf-H2C2 2 domain contai ning protein n=1 Tax=Trichuris trichiura TaxID=36087 RepID=A0A077ZHH9_TRITR|nr:zf-C2H2 and zf-C2H2 4 and zf-H2C2 2 domain contai ning protein [Trichuris trichiura]